MTTLISNQKRHREQRLSDLIFFNSLRTLSYFVIFIFLSVLVFLLIQSFDTLKSFGTGFFVSSTWSPTREIFGALPFIYGTLMSSLLALIIAVPISVGSALFLTEISPKYLKTPVQFLIEMLAAVPSVVYGLWGVFVLAPFVRTFIQPFLRDNTTWMPLFQGPPYGIGLFTSGVVLAIMITPTITSICTVVFSSVPVIHKEGAKALGATDWESIKIAVIKPGLAGILAAVMLGLGRAMGETMAVTMVIGNRADISSSLFSPAATMASIIANEFPEANSKLHISSLCAIGLTLLLVSLLVNSIARIIIYQFRGRKNA